MGALHGTPPALMVHLPPPPPSLPGVGACPRERFSCGACGTCGAPKAKPRSDTNLKNDFSHIMLQITCVPLINSLPADIIFDSFGLVVVQWNRETQTLRRACGAKSVLQARGGMRCCAVSVLSLGGGWGRGGASGGESTSCRSCFAPFRPRHPPPPTAMSGTAPRHRPVPRVQLQHGLQPGGHPPQHH